MSFGASRSGFFFLSPDSGVLSCASFPNYIPSVGNSYNPLTDGVVQSATAYPRSRFISAQIAAGAGRIGSLASLKCDVAGASNYGTDDFVLPGSPWEGYSFEVTQGSTQTYIGASNLGYINGNSITSGTMYRMNDKHYAVLMGDTMRGHVVSQIQILEDEPVVRFKMSYTNTTSAPVTVKAMRALDPDQDVGPYGSFYTRNSRGNGTISATDVVNAESTRASGKSMSIYIPGDGYTHNTGIIPNWPNLVPGTVLNYTSSRDDGDYGIGVAWNFGTVAPGATVNGCCFYVMGIGLSAMASIIQQ